MNADQRLSHALMMKYGLSGSEPSFAQLKRIKSDLEIFISGGLALDESHWDLVVRKHCSTVDSCRYYGLDNSDLNALLKVALILSEEGMLGQSALNKFRQDVVTFLGPVYWDPSDVDVRNLAEEIASKNPRTFLEVKRIFQKHFPDVLYSVFEGVDNSDLRTLLAMVLASAKAASK